MTVVYVPRATWGAQPWRPKNEMYQVPDTERFEVLAHYHGNPPTHDRGVAMAKDIEAIHLANGWAGVGYNFMIGQDGVAYEGRGWPLVGAHCPEHNRIGWGFYFAVGGDQVPSDAAKHTFRALYNEGCTRARRQLRKTWHGANYPTDCPGANAIAWVRAGMLDPISAPPKEDNMPTVEELWKWKISYGGEDTTPLEMLREVTNTARALVARIEELEKKITPGS